MIWVQSLGSSWCAIIMFHGWIFVTKLHVLHNTLLTDWTIFISLGTPLVISHNGASGVYPDCTDLAYQQAFEDGADFIDCPVQLTRDGIPICMSSINLVDGTDAATSELRSRLSVVPDIQSTPGLFTFNLTLEEIQKNLKRK